ncbi:hydrolethalus syndrome protein 1 [Callorhinchus milii]|uniref:Hydrolethalus syndrome protein 1-like protein n=1 Tax=Callorhinchus milii TaxID=7868 RepID=V9KYW0_CALMI|nr:hydrolethalus syndrome protein 1 [Callorhinchus milii]|eukprot:gi/632961252/ref/XP_007896652.1/ PREDICTED: hydrolethalus syndrome protein 1 [Callorhinchus milii]
MEFTEEQIQQHLALLGYSNIPEHRLQEFKKDLEELINHERSKSNSTTSFSPESVESKASSNHVSQARIQSTCQPLAATQITQQEFSSGKENQVALPSNGRGFLHRHPGRYCQPDSYISSSVAPNPSQFRCNSAPCTLMLHNSPDQESNSSQAHSDNNPEGPCGSKRKPTLRRKVLRKKNGEVQVCDESVTSETDCDSVSELEQRISRFQTLYHDAESDEESEESRSIDSGIIAYRGPGSAQTYFTRDMWSHRPTGNEGSNALCGPKSFIRPVMDHPHTRNLKKTDPVTKYFEYKREWDTFKMPGEKDQKELRWVIRQQMLYKSRQPPKPQRMYIPNDYIVPTDKKRSALRWGIRHDMANGTIPHKLFYPL